MNESSFRRSLDPPAARELAEVLSSLSERLHCARWMREWEREAWMRVQKPARFPARPDGPMTEDDIFGPVGGLTAEDVLRVKSLAVRCGGWIVWTSGEGRTWIPLDHWIEEYAEMSEPTATAEERRIRRHRARKRLARIRARTA